MQGTRGHIGIVELNMIINREEAEVTAVWGRGKVIIKSQGFDMLTK